MKQLYPFIGTADAIEGEWQFTVLDGKTRKVVREYEPFKNLITDIGLDQLGSNSSIFTHCRIGTGTAAAAITDTQLQSQSASTSTQISASSVNAGAPNYESTTTLVYEFALGAVVGNMAEIGAGWSPSTASTLFSRARINDAGGSPTTITVLVTEILQATYRITLYPKLTDDTGAVTIGGVGYTYTSRRYNIATAQSILGSSWPKTVGSPQSFSGTLSAITGTGPTGGTATLADAGFTAYTPGTYYIDQNISASITQGNTPGGIKSIGFILTNSSGMNIHRQIEFNVVIPKDNTKTMTLVIRNSWARYP